MADAVQQSPKWWSQSLLLIRLRQLHSRCILCIVFAPFRRVLTVCWILNLSSLLATMWSTLTGSFKKTKRGNEHSSHVSCWLILQKHFKGKYTIHRWLHPHFAGPHQINTRPHTYIKDSQPIFIFEWVQSQLVFQNLTHPCWPTLPLFVAELQDPLHILLGHWVVIFQGLKGKHKARCYSFISLFIFPGKDTAVHITWQTACRICF